MKNKKYLLFLLLIPIIIIIGRSFALPINSEIKTISLESDNYDEAGSLHIDKSVTWVESGKVKLTIDVKSIEKNDFIKYKDVVIVMDASNAMDGRKLEKAKSDAKTLVNDLLKDLHNKVALITFDNEATIKSNFTNNKEELNEIIRDISKNNKPNYNNALLKVDELLNNYDKYDNRDLVVLFLANGNTSEGVPNEIATYGMLKDKYSYITINGIQYESEMDILDGIKNITDTQWVVSNEKSEDKNKNNLEDSIIASNPYEKLNIIDTINSDYFVINDIKDIKKDSGEIELKVENGNQKIYWNLDNTRTGVSHKLEVTLSLRLNYLLEGGSYKTNKDLTVKSKLSNDSEKTISTTNSPVINNKYTVHYDFNKPGNCTLEEIPDEMHFVYENVTKKTGMYRCDGYVFKGWDVRNPENEEEHLDHDYVKQVNGDVFKMPDQNITLYAKWSKPTIVKNMGGEVKETIRDTLMVHGDNSDYTFGRSISRYSFETLKIVNHTRVPANAIDSWDVSAEQSGSVIAWYTDVDEDEKYELYIGAQGGVLANPDSSYAFYDFEYVNEFDFTYLDTSEVTNMYEMFAYLGYYAYDADIDLDLRHFNTSNVTTMEGAFSGLGYYANSTSINASNWNTSNVTSLYWMFECFAEENKIITIDASNWDVSNVTNMRYMFEDVGEDYADVVNINISGWKFSDTTVNSYELCYEMFEYSGNYAKVYNLNMSNWDFSSVTNFENDDCFYEMFYYSGYELEEFNIDMSGWKFSGIADFGDDYSCFYEMFYYSGCYAEVININMDNWDFSNSPNLNDYYLFYYMFYYFGYYAQTFNVSLNNFNFTNVDHIYYPFYEMFYYCAYYSKNINIDMNNWNVSNIDVNYDTSVIGEMFYYDFGQYAENININMKNWKLPNFDEAYNFFYEAFYYVGYYGSNVNFTADLSNWDLSKVTNLSSLFYYLFYGTGNNATTYKLIGLDTWDTSNITNMNDLFYYVGENATSFDIGDLSNWDTSNVTTMSEMFYRAGYNATTWNSIGTLKIYANNISDIFYSCPNARATLNIYSNPTSYGSAFDGAATSESSGIVVNYKENVSDIDNIIATKSSNSNITKGELLEE